MGGDGLLGAVAGELRGTGGVLGVLPGGRGNDFARKLGIGSDPGARLRRARRRPPAAGRRRRCRRAHVPRDRVGRLRLRRAGHRQRRRGSRSARLVYVYATLRALRGWRHARWEVDVDGEAQAFDGYSVAVANSGVFGGGMYLVPDASLDDGMLDVVLTARAPQVALPRGPAEGVQGHARRQPGPDLPARPRDQLPRRPPVRRICRRRPDRRPARHHQGRAARARRCWSRDAAGPEGRPPRRRSARSSARRGRGGGTSLPGKVLTRLEPHAIGAAGAAPARTAAR